MHIVISASLSFEHEIALAAQQLHAAGHRVTAPQRRPDLTPELHGQLIREYLDEIARCDQLLVINADKPDQRSYIGPGSLLEIGVAVHCEKPITLLHPLDMTAAYADEVAAVTAMLSGDVATWAASL